MLSAGKLHPSDARKRYSKCGRDKQQVLKYNQCTTDGCDTIVLASGTEASGNCSPSSLAVAGVTCTSTDTIAQGVNSCIVLGIVTFTQWNHGNKSRGHDMFIAVKL